MDPLIGATLTLGVFGLVIGIIGLYFANRERKAKRARRAAMSNNPASSPLR
jgi:hypothetical protein